MISAFRNKISSFTPLFVSSYRGIHSKNLARPTSTDPAEVNPKSYESLKVHNWLVYDTKHEVSFFLNFNSQVFFLAFKNNT